jgi:hypothetical protein
MLNGRLFRESTGFADKKAAERRVNEIELASSAPASTDGRARSRSR